MKSHYLLDLLRQHSRVIIPNFGAFLLKVKPQSDSDTDLQINFNDFLKFNDGLLIDHVAKTEKIDKYEAEHQVKEYVSKIQYSLINDGSYEIEGLGTIHKDEKGGLKYVQLGGDLIQKNTPTEKPEGKKQTSKTGLSPLMSGQDDPKKEQRKMEMEKSKYEIPKKEQFNAPAEKPQVKTVSKPVSTATSQPAKPTKPPRKKRKLLPIWRHALVILSVLLIVAIILFLAGFFDSPQTIPEGTKKQIAQTSLFEGNKTTEQQYNSNNNVDQNTASEAAQGDEQNMTDATNDPTTKQDSKATSLTEDNLNDKSRGSKTSTPMPNTEAGKTSPNTQNTEKAIPAQSQSGLTSEVKPFHIIAGSFNDKGNAYNFVLKLRAKGFDSRIVNKHNGFYRVSFNSYPTKAQALTALPDLRKNQNPDAWYLYQN